jgi:hypothetical protein
MVRSKRLANSKFIPGCNAAWPFWRMCCVPKLRGRA